jgi:hypothetical protein
MSAGGAQIDSAQCGVALLAARSADAATSVALMVSRASWIARRIRTIHGEPCSSGREAMVPAVGRKDGCRLATTLELRRSTNRAPEVAASTLRACRT